MKFIKDEKEYDEALAEIEKLFDAKPNTLEADRLEILVTLVEFYEEKYFPIAFPNE